MILQPRAAELLLIRQTDHAALSGVLAEHWGNAEFAPLAPRDSMVRAAAHHDDGWRQWEAAPRVDPRARRPYQFTDLPLAEHAAFYLSGVDEVASQDAYAGLLVCLHLSGLYQRRFGIDPGIPVRTLSLEEGRARSEVIEQLAARQQSLRNRLASSAEPVGLLEEGHVLANYKLLQIFDRLSLYFCTSPPRPMTLRPAPADYRGCDAELALDPLGGQVVRVTPWPFDVASLPARVRASVVPDRPYHDDADFRAAFAAAPATELHFELRSP
ncbi:MAG TPA: DUF3891 family protein [Gemmataceae bacterium]|jgi:hypothetical protein|nr:DUF3891 family protein [Gemmataceae bacterium]